jgi:hypothetical protein
MDDHTDELDPTQVGLGEIASGGQDDESSLLDALAQQRDELATERETDIPLPNYGKSGVTLYVRYRLLDGKDLEKIGKRVISQFKKGQNYERQLYSSIDVMIEACEGFFVDRGDGEKQPVTLGGIPISGYGEQLATALRFADKIDQRSPARSCVLNFFGDNIVSIQQHSIVLGRWMGNTTADVTTELLEQEGNL